MCARHTLSAAEKTILAAYAAEMVDPYSPNYNIAITDETPVITADEPELLQNMHFGLVPWFAESTKLTRDTWNARDDNLLSSKMWKPLLTKTKTCLVVSDSFIEWKKLDDGARDPYRFALKDREVYSYAGLWSEWKDKVTGSTFRSYAIVTTACNELVGEIRDKQRMPFILNKEKESLWLDNGLTIDDKLSLIESYPDELMTRHPLDRRINKVNSKKARNNDPALLLPRNSS